MPDISKLYKRMSIKEAYDKKMLKQGQRVRTNGNGVMKIDEGSRLIEGTILCPGSENEHIIIDRDNGHWWLSTGNDDAYIEFLDDYIEVAGNNLETAEAVAEFMVSKNTV